MAAKKSREATSKSPTTKKAGKAPVRGRQGAKAKTSPATRLSAADDAQMKSFTDAVGRLAAESGFCGGKCRVEKKIVNGKLVIRVICP